MNQQSDSESVLVQAAALVQSNNISEAKSLLLSLDDNTKSHHEAQFLMGVCEYKLKNFSVALEYLEVAVESNPRAANYRVSYAAALVRVGRDELAKDQYSLVLMFAPNNMDALCQLGKITLRQGRVLDAEIYYERALNVNTDSLPALLGMGHCLQMKGAHENSLDFYERVLVLNPGDREAIVNHKFMLLAVNVRNAMAS